MAPKFLRPPVTPGVELRVDGKDEGLGEHAEPCGLAEVRWQRTHGQRLGGLLELSSAEVRVGEASSEPKCVTSSSEEKVSR